MTMAVFSAEAIKKRVRTHLIGREIRYWPKVEPTNAMAQRMAAEGAAEGDSGARRRPKPWPWQGSDAHGRCSEIGGGKPKESPCGDC
jgi:hypothetical protein